MPPPAPVAARATTPPADATPAPEAANANSVGGFSLSRQLGLGVSRIVIDPGHGGHDPGAQGKGLTESELTLDLALRLEEMLKKEPGSRGRSRAAQTSTSRSRRAPPSPTARAPTCFCRSTRMRVGTLLRAASKLTSACGDARGTEAVAARENPHTWARCTSSDMIKAIALNNKLDESRDLAAMVKRRW